MVWGSSNAVPLARNGGAPALKSGRLIKRPDVETSGILGIVKATFIPSRPARRRLIRKRRGWCHQFGHKSDRAILSRTRLVNRQADLRRHPARPLFVEWPDRCE